MKRRDFIAGLGSAAIAWPRSAFSQRSKNKVWKIGWISGGRRPVRIETSTFGEFAKGMQGFGHAEGRDFVMEWRFAETRFDLIPVFAAELVKLNVDVIVVSAAQAVRAAQQATKEIPIVMSGPPNPVVSGFVTSLARPGGNTTGQSSAAEDMIFKHIDLLIKAVPNLKRVAMIVNPPTRFNSNVLENVYRNLEEAAKNAGVAVSSFAVGTSVDIEPAFIRMRQDAMQAVIVPGEPFTMS